MKYEELIIDSTFKDIYEIDMQTKGLYADGIIAISKRLDPIEKACILAEELGHYYTSCGNILCQDNIENIKQEQRARNWAFNCLLPPERFIEAFRAGCINRHEVADFLEVTEEFLLNAICHYKKRYGTYISIDRYIIFFEPNFAIMHLLE